MNNKQLLNKDVQRVINTLKRLPKEYEQKALKKVLKESSKPLMKAAKANVPTASKPVKRYKNGKVIATYFPNNLKRAIGFLTKLRRTKAVFVGARLSKSGTSGEFKGNRVDAYYAHIVEHGSVHQKGVHFLEKAYLSTKQIVFSKITAKTKAILKTFKRKNNIK